MIDKHTIALISIIGCSLICWERYISHMIFSAANTVRCER
jgi:hypothetical protein